MRNLYKNANIDEVLRQSALVLHNRMLGNEQDAVRYNINRLPEDKRVSYVNKSLPLAEKISPWANTPWKYALGASIPTLIASMYINKDNPELQASTTDLEQKHKMYRDLLFSTASNKKTQEAKDLYNQAKSQVSNLKNTQFLKNLIPTILTGIAGYTVGNTVKSDKNEKMLSKMLEYAGLSPNIYQQETLSKQRLSDIANFYKV